MAIVSIAGNFIITNGFLGKRESNNKDVLEGENFDIDLNFNIADNAFFSKLQ